MKQLIAVVMLSVLFGGIKIDGDNIEIAYAKEREEKKALLEIVAEPKTVEQKIRQAFPEEPDRMVKVAECESGLQNIKGKLSDDGGIFQLNQVHLPRMKELGLDRFNIDDNIRFARMLYDEHGTQPWYKSKPCWNV